MKYIEKMDSNSQIDDNKNQNQQQKQKQEKEDFHVLAVDDNLIDRKLLERLLTVSSYQVTCVESGDKALEYLGLIDYQTENVSSSANPLSASISTAISSSSSLPSPSQSRTDPSQQLKQLQGLKVNLIITDYSMPGISGYDLLKRVKGSSWKDIPVIVVSSENVPSRINMCLEEGAEEFLLKPVKLSDLRKIQSNLVNVNSFGHPYEHIGNSTVNGDNNGNDSRSNDEESCDGANKIWKSAESSERIPKLKELAVL